MITAKKNTKKINNIVDNSINKNDDYIEQYFGCKYLTSSELLSLQIRDPFFRQQLCAQILFYVNFLRYLLIYLLIY